MNKVRMVFSQVMDFASQDIFKVCVTRYKGNYKAKDFTCWKQFLCLAFGQLTHRESMSDTMLCLELNADKLYHLGIGTAVNKSTLSRANEKRDWRIFQDFGLKLIDQARALYAGDNQLEVRLKGNVFSLDSTTVDLCLDVFWWASFRKAKGAVKLHTLLDLKTSIPQFIHISNGSVHDVNILDIIPIEKGSYYVLDKGYIDFDRLFRIKEERAYFIIRARENLQFVRLSSRKVSRDAGIICDQDIQLKGFYSKRHYPAPLRRVRFYDAEYGRTLVFLTNNFKLSAETVAQLYKHRWQIELFFKWIKQHLKVQSFWGYTENAVRIQIWVAISVYVLVAIAKKRLNLKHSLYEILQYISLSPFEKARLSDVFINENRQDVKEQNTIQLKFL
jgi:IS4 transposase